MRTRAVQITMFLSAGVLLTALTLRSQAPASVVWEYGSVKSSLGGGTEEDVPYSDADICLPAPEGCHTQHIRAKGAESDALLKAANIMGAQGWEITAVGDAPGSRTIYFRRLKSGSR
jgi:hypothetical protein